MRTAAIDTSPIGPSPIGRSSMSARTSSRAHRNIGLVSLSAIGNAMTMPLATGMIVIALMLDVSMRRLRVPRIIGLAGQGIGIATFEPMTSILNIAITSNTTLDRMDTHRARGGMVITYPARTVRLDTSSTITRIA